MIYEELQEQHSMHCLQCHLIYPLHEGVEIKISSHQHYVVVQQELSFSKATAAVHAEKIKALN